ncbi:MAG: hypothetical protein KDA64_09605 [Rhodospirillaceae bacterium]|nr:hypothetical protein [Rhodospirillaceae bacterium]
MSRPAMDFSNRRLFATVGITLAAGLVAAAVFGASAAPWARPGSPLLQSLAIAGAVLLLVSFAAVLAKRFGRPGKAGFRAHVVLASLGLAGVLAHWSFHVIQFPTLLLLLLLALVALGVWSRSAGAAQMAGTFGRKHAAFAPPAPATRERLRALIGEKRAMLAALDPAASEARVQRGLLRLEGGDAAGALADLDAVLAATPDRLDAQRGRAAALVTLGRNGEAVAAYDTLIAAMAAAETEVPPLLYHDRGVARRLAADFSGALADFDRVIATQPERLSAHVNRARALLGLGEIAAAEGALDAALDLDATSAEALALRGMVRRIAGRLEASLADLDRAVAQDPSAAFAREQRALARTLDGDLEGALADLRTAWADAAVLAGRQADWLAAGTFAGPTDGRWTAETEAAARRWLAAATGTALPEATQ